MENREVIDFITSLLQRRYLGNTFAGYISVIAVFLVASVAMVLIKKAVVSRLRAAARKTISDADDFLVNVVDRKVIPVLYVATLFLSIRTLVLSAQVERLVVVGFTVVIAVLVVRLVISSLRFALQRAWYGAGAARGRALKGIETGLQIVVWVLAVIVVLDNVGVKISSLVAGLGIGGVALALASQAVLGDLFSYFTMSFDRPFEIGDFIIIDDFMGTVEHIGIKSTRIRSLGGEQLIFRNTDLTSARVRNYKRMERRRVVFALGVTYSTSSDSVKQIPRLIQTIIEGVADTSFDRAHFKAFGDFSLIYEVVYYVLSADYNKYMDIQQAINVRIKEEFAKENIEFAFPTQTVFLASPAGPHASVFPAAQEAR